MPFERITEQPSQYHHLERMTIHDLLYNINKEDQKVAAAVERVIPHIEKLVTAIADKMLSGGRLFYIGAGTSGRLAIVDASECPPTFGVPEGLVSAIIAGGEKAITRAVEFAEDDTEKAWEELRKRNISDLDVVVGIASSGTTPFVMGAIKKCKEAGITTGSISCNKNAPLSKLADFPIEVIVGPEFITGSTRMKSGTAQKLILNMISTTVMIQLGRIEDNHMVHMQLTNEKLFERAVRMIMEKGGVEDYQMARSLLVEHKNVKAVFNRLNKNF